MVITIKYSLAFLVAFATAGIGFYVAACASGIFKKSSFTASIAAALLSFAAAAAFLIITVGNPSRLFNVLSNPMSGFSMMTIGVILMLVLSVVALGVKKGPAFYIVAVVGLAVSACLFYGLVLMFVKPSRMALNSWHIPMFMFAAVLAMAGCAAGSRVMRLSGLVLKAVAVGAFLLHLKGLAIPDRYLSMDLIMNYAALLMFGWVIGVGIVLPLITELVGKKRKAFTLAEALFIFAGNAAFFMLINITASRTGNMI